MADEYIFGVVCVFIYIRPEKLIILPRSLGHFEYSKITLTWTCHLSGIGDLNVNLNDTGSYGFETNMYNFVHTDGGWSSINFRINVIDSCNAAFVAILSFSIYPSKTYS